jgi:hypothetical protein
MKPNTIQTDAIHCVINILKTWIKKDIDNPSLDLEIEDFLQSELMYDVDDNIIQNMNNSLCLLLDDIRKIK